jgi:hypothetical protein
MSANAKYNINNVPTTADTKYNINNVPTTAEARRPLTQ